MLSQAGILKDSVQKQADKEYFLIMMLNFNC